MSKHKDWFDKHVIIDFGDFNNKEDKKKADDLKEKLKEKLEEELDTSNSLKHVTRQVKWAILFTPFEQEDTEYVKEGCGAMWDDKSPVKVFDTYEDAQKECAKWNTGEIVRWIINEQHNFEGERNE